MSNERHKLNVQVTCTYVDSKSRGCVAVIKYEVAVLNANDGVNC